MNIDTIPDHELAKRELAEFFKTLNLKTQVSPPMAGVDAGTRARVPLSAQRAETRRDRETRRKEKEK